MFNVLAYLLLPAILAHLPVAYAQGSRVVPNTWPHLYPGAPEGDFSPEWQNCELLHPSPGTTTNIIISTRL